METYKTIKRLIATITVSALLLPVSAFASPVTCYCVLYLREVLGINVKGNADQIQPNVPIQDVHVGDVVLLTYGSVGHAALVTSVQDEVSLYNQRKITGFTIQESNFYHCQPSMRTIGMSNVRGIYRPLYTPMYTFRNGATSHSFL